MSLLTDLRSVMPERRLSFLESRVLAERQATVLLRRLGIEEPAVPSQLLARLPFVKVAARTPMHSSGASKWVKPRWVILVNGAEPITRQRFSLGHELKHVLDHPLAPVIYGDITDRATRRSVEHVCDYFSACLLMPRTWVKNAYASGIQDEIDLAELFDVSAQAMHVRLLQLGITATYERHSEMDNTYFRSKPVLLPELAA